MQNSITDDRCSSISGVRNNLHTQLDFSIHSLILDDMYLSQRKKAVEDALRGQFSWRLKVGLSKHCTGERESARDKVG